MRRRPRRGRAEPDRRRRRARRARARRCSTRCARWSATTGCAVSCSSSRAARRRCPPIWCCRPSHPEADAGFIIMESSSYEGMSGTNTINTAAVLLETGLVEMVEPVTEMVLEAPAGLVRVRADCADGRVERITFENVPSFVDGARRAGRGPGRRLAARRRRLRRRVLRVRRRGGAWASRSCPTRRARSPTSASRSGRTSTSRSRSTTRSATSRSWSSSPRRASAVTPATPRSSPPAGSTARPPARPRQPGSRCSTRAGRWARRYVAESVIDTRFEGRIVRREGSAVVPAITGRAWITGFHQLVVDPRDPLGAGFKLGDTWGAGDVSRACSASELPNKGGVQVGWSRFVAVRRFVPPPERRGFRVSTFVRLSQRRAHPTRTAPSP